MAKFTQLLKEVLQWLLKEIFFYHFATLHKENTLLKLDYFMLHYKSAHT